MSTHANMVKMTVSSVSATPSTGKGDITLNAASTGFQSFADAYGANATVDILITKGAEWEVARNCTYTHSGTTLTRGTWEDSSNGTGAIVADNTAVVSVVATAALGNRTEMALQAVTPGGRLTLESGVPVSTTDQTAKTSIYYTPYVHNIINLWDGAEWKPIIFTEHTVTGAALTGLTSGKPYDVFAYLDSGALATELLVWTNDTTRATAVTLQDGRYCKSGDKTRLLLGTIYTTGTTTTADAVATRYVSNVYNTVLRKVYLEDVTSHSYATNTTRYYRAQSSNVVSFVSAMSASVNISVYGNAFGDALVAVAPVDVAGTSEAVAWSIYQATNNSGTGGATYADVVAAGKHYYALAQRAPIATTATYYSGILTGFISA